MWTRKRFILILALALCLFVIYKQISLVDRIKKYTRSQSHGISANHIYSTDQPHTGNVNLDVQLLSVTTEPNKHEIKLHDDFDQKMRKFNMSSPIVDKIFELYKEREKSTELEKKQLSDFLYAMNIVDKLPTTDFRRHFQEPQQQNPNAIRQSIEHNNNMLNDLHSDKKSKVNENLLNQNHLNQNFGQESNDKQSLAVPNKKGDDSVKEIFKTDNSVHVSTGRNNATEEVNKFDKSHKNTSGFEDAADDNFKKTLIRINKFLNAGKNGTANLKNKETSSNTDIQETRKLSTESSRPDTCENCFNNSFKMIINHSPYCKQFTDLNLIILISSAPQEQNARMVLRNTWATLCTRESQIGFLFVLGKSRDISVMEKVKQENSVYHDIIQFSFIDTYTNLTYKTLSGLRWADRFCNNSKFIMKMDTDVYLNTELLPLLLQALPRENFLGGYCWGKSRPERDASSKWYVSFRSYQGRFPPMCSGTGYILSQNLIPKLLTISSNIPFFHLEDVYVAICMQKLGVTPVNLYGFHNMMQNFEACAYRNEILTSHLFRNNQLTAFWNLSRSCEQKKLSPSDIYKPIPLQHML